jgi:hypothetical protein
LSKKWCVSSLLEYLFFHKLFIGKLDKELSFPGRSKNH